MFDGLCRWWRDLRHPDQNVYKTATKPIVFDETKVPGERQATQLNPIRFRVSGATEGRKLRVVDADTGRPIPVFAAQWTCDVMGKSELTLKAYLQDFEYEGEGTLFTFCPKCKEEVKARRSAPLEPMEGHKPIPGLGPCGQSGVKASHSGTGRD